MVTCIFQSFLDYFARALNYEYKGKGITIQSLMPFYVNTKMTRYSKTLTSHSFLVPSASDYAHHAVATLGYSGRTSGYWPHTIQVTTSKMLSKSGVQNFLRLLINELIHEIMVLTT